MHELIDRTRRDLEIVRAEQTLIAAGRADQVAGGAEAAAKRAVVALKVAEKRLADAQDAARKAGSDIIAIVHAAAGMRGAGGGSQPANTCREHPPRNYEAAISPPSMAPTGTGSPFAGLLGGMVAEMVMRGTVPAMAHGEAAQSAANGHAAKHGDFRNL